MDEGQIIQKLQSRDKDEILDIPTLLLNERDIDLNALIAIAAKAEVESEILALINQSEKVREKVTRWVSVFTR